MYLSSCGIGIKRHPSRLAGNSGLLAGAVYSFAALLFLMSGPAAAGDWPQWRYDAGRTAAGPHSLADDLHLHWTRKLPPLTPAWEDPVNQDRMPFDRNYEPVVIGQTMLVGSSRNDSLTAFDTRTGSERWRFYADGPVRLPPVGFDGKVAFASDDGWLYCLAVSNGELIWKFRGGPDRRKVLGNGRLISAWPARGGPVLDDGVIYFAASIWPFMGVFIHALNAETGQVIWTNDALGSTYIDQPHSGSTSFAGIAPQGSLAVVGDKLIVPGGRSVPGCVDKKTGKLLYFHLSGSEGYKGRGNGNSKLEGGSHVCGAGNFFLNHRGICTSLYDLETGDLYRLWQRTTYPVVDGNLLYLSGSQVEAYDIAEMRQVEEPTRKIDKATGKEVSVVHHLWQPRQLWQKRVDSCGGMIKAGGQLYVGGKGEVSAVDLTDEAHRVTWRAQVNGSVARIIAADDRLFVVTLEGGIYAFGAGQRAVEVHETPDRSFSPADPPEQVETILSSASVEKGYCLIFGLKDGRLAEGIARSGKYRVIAADADPQKVERLRRKFDAYRAYGGELAVLPGSPETLSLPPYLAALTIVQDPAAAGYDGSKEFIESLYHSMRPYGGVAWIGIPKGSERKRFERMLSAADLVGAKVTERGEYLLLTRHGPLQGSGSWTHQYGDIANTAKASDNLVRLPLGLLWFGGNSHEDVLPRHGHGPPEQVVGGRLFIEGTDCLSARDVYTGMVLWKRKFPGLDTFGIYYDSSYRKDPLDITYNQKHIPGANARGANYVATEDAIYLVAGNGCLVLDPATGTTINNIELPKQDRNGPGRGWSYIGVYEDLLLCGSGFVPYSRKLKLPADAETPYDTSASRELVVMDRHTGRVIWRRKAESAFLNNAIVAGGGKIFCIDGAPAGISKMLQRRGIRQPFHALLALDARSGRLVWRSTSKVFGTWLSYSGEHDLLIQAGRDSRDMLPNEPTNRMAAHRGADGSIAWNRRTSYAGPIIIHNNKLYLNSAGQDGGAMDIRTGQTLMRTNPITGRRAPWRYGRRYGCNYVIASEHLLMFRSGAAGYFDLDADGGTGNLGGFKSGCTSNLVAADGVLNAPDYTRTCTCAYQNQTSLALVHAPDVETWTFNKYGPPRPTAVRVKRVGINFAAPGDRKSDSGTLWLDWPSVGGPSPDVPVGVEPYDAAAFRHHSSRIVSGKLPWVAASGLEGVRQIRIALNLSAKGQRIVAAARAVEPRPYTVRLCFSDPSETQPGRRLFDVHLQGRKLLDGFDIVKETGGPNRAIFKTFEGIMLANELRIDFAAVKHLPLICGVEVVAEE